MRAVVRTPVVDFRAIGDTPTINGHHFEQHVLSPALHAARAARRAGAERGVSLSPRVTIAGIHVSDRTTGLLPPERPAEITPWSLHESERTPLEVLGFFGFSVVAVVNPHS